MKHVRSALHPCGCAMISLLLTLIILKLKEKYIMKLFKVAELIESKPLRPQQFFTSLNLLRFLRTISFVLCCILSKLPLLYS